jgi:ketosteroid isomerase-like protein
MVQAPVGGSASFERLVDEFGKAWEAGRPSAMAEVFTDDGTFTPGPFEGALRGRVAIAAYWGDVPKEQSAISFRFGEIFVVGPWFATEFKCTFRRIRTGDWIEVSGALFCETTAEKISEMRMYWDRSKVQAP